MMSLLMKDQLPKIKVKNKSKSTIGRKQQKTNTFEDFITTLGRF